MRVLFLLPDIQDVPTGGNIYNTKIVDALHLYAEVMTRVVYEGDDLEIGQLEAFDFLVVDSLLVDVIAPATFPKTGSSPKWLLLVHYLTACDPAKQDLDFDGLLASLGAYDGFIATSQYSKACLVRLGIAAPLVEVVYPGLDEAYHPDPQNEKSAGCRILTVSSLLPGKGLVEFVDVLEQLPAEDWQWDVVGDDGLDGAYAAAFKGRIKNSSLSSQLRWLRPISPVEMPALYRSYDLFVLPSHFETLGMAIREAMASGLPVIAYDVGGISESLGQGGGYLIPPFEQVKMGDKIWLCVEDDDLRRWVGYDALELCRSFPSWEVSAKQMAGFLTDILA